jgi:hypothetical protein
MELSTAPVAYGAGTTPRSSGRTPASVSEHHVGGCDALAVERWVRHLDHPHPGGACGLDADGRVLDGHAARRLDAELAGGEQVDVGRRLAACDAWVVAQLRDDGGSRAGRSRGVLRPALTRRAT